MARKKSPRTKNGLACVYVRLTEKSDNTHTLYVNPAPGTGDIMNHTSKLLRETCRIIYRHFDQFPPRLMIEPRCNEIKVADTREFQRERVNKLSVVHGGLASKLRVASYISWLPDYIFSETRILSICTSGINLTMLAEMGGKKKKNVAKMMEIRNLAAYQWKVIL